MTDTMEETEQPKKPRKPRSDKGVKRTPAKPRKQAAEKEEKAEKQPRGKKLPNFVRQDGKIITISGGDVFCRPLDAAARQQWGVKEVKGSLGSPCRDEELVLTFKSPKAAVAFFDHSFEAESEDDEIIVAGGRTDWESESISGF